MHVTNTTKKFVASAVISELQSSDIYLTVKARLFDLNANLNGVRVTAEFMNEIVQNEDKYIGIPLYADVRGLINNKAIGHMYDSKTGEFHSTQIGSFYHYELEADKDTIYLAGYARVPKRNKAVCQAIADLFATNDLKFSFEISCGSYTEEEDGTFVIDADPRNYFEGEAIVTFPACEGAVATALVAELALEVESKGDENMQHDELKEAEVVEEKAEVEVQAETEQVEAEEKAEEVTAETAEEPKAEEVVAEEAVAEEAEPEEVKAEADDAKDDEDPEDKEEDEMEEASYKKECSESFAEKFEKLIAELQAQVASLSKQIAEMEKPVEVKAEKEPEQVNPFVAEISTPKKYSLLDREEKTTTTYSLLDRA